MFGESVFTIAAFTDVICLAIWLITPKKSLTAGQNSELSASRQDKYLFETFIQNFIYNLVGLFCNT